MRVKFQLSRILAPALILVLLAVMMTPGAALAARGAGGKPGGTSGGSSSLSLVLLDSTDGLPHWGQRVTFNISTTATTQPYVDLKCYQSGALVASGTAGFFDGYPWPSTQIMTLASPSWTSGAADCSARLYYLAGSKTVTVTTLSFHVYA